MVTIAQEGPSLERFQSEVPGLDALLGGGLVTGSVFIIQGAPGTGKTVLGSQMAFNCVKRGGHVLYVTLLGESHGRLLAHLSNLSFFDTSAVAKSLFYVSGINALYNEGVEGMLRLIATEATQRNVSLVVLDGLFVVEEIFESEKEFRRFMNDVSHQAELLNCTVILLTNSQRPATSPEYTMVDGWMKLGSWLADYRAFRYIEIHKFRGSDYLTGRHFITITDDGITVLPRLEAVVGNHPERGVRDGRMDTGVQGLDRMLGGGLPLASTTLLMGPPGVGKTSLGLQMLAHCSPGGTGLIFGFYETRERLAARARSLGMDLQALVENGSVHIVWHSPTENLLDGLGHDLLDHVRRHGIKRLFVDGIGPFRQAALYSGRIGRYLAALTNALREMSCTAVFTAEIPTVVGGESDARFGNLSAIAENIIFLRYSEGESDVHRTVRLIKVRESEFDGRVRELFITPDGLRVGRPFSSSEMGLTGSPYMSNPP